MDANEIVDIPDTPDRVCKSKKDERSESSLISCSEDLIMFSGRKDSAPQNQSEGRFIHHRRGINISEPSGNGRSTMVSSVHRHSLASENATLYRKVGNKPSKPDVRYSVNSQHADNKKDVYPKCSSTPVNHPEHHMGKCMMGGNTSRLQETSPQCVLEEGNASKLKGDLLASSSLYSSQGPSNEKHIIHPEHHMGKFMMRGNTNRLQKSSPQCLLEERNTSKSKGDLLVSSSFYSSQGPSKEKHIIHPELHMGKCMIGGNTNRLQKTSPQCVLEEGNASKSKGDLLPINSFYSSQDTSKENNVLNKGKEKINSEACKAVPSSFAMQKCLFSTKDDGDVQKLSGHTSVTVHSGTSSRAAGKKRLVRNGCISPHNVAKAKKSTESSSNCNGYIKRISPNEIAEVDPSVVFNADGEFSSSSKSKVKGKEIVSHPFSSGKHDIKMGDSTKRESGVAPLMNQNHRDTFKRHKKDRKLLSSQDRDEEILFIGSRSKPSSSGSHTQQNRRRPNALKTVIEIDEHSPTVRSSNSQSDNGLTAAAKARQVEADEMLARELQEQLYHEMPPIQDADIDSRLAWRLQQEENVQQALRSEIAVNLRVSSSPQPRRQSRSQLFQNRYRRAAPVQPPTSRLARLRASMHSHSRLLPSQMDLDARVELLEALEAVGNDDMNMVNQLINPARDFNENDYDMLLALDEHNHHHLGATSAQISNLPESIVQTSTGDSCSICLEEPEIGETIRHLPCLHKFHKDCIDSWLRRKRSCPVCKCDVT